MSQLIPETGPLHRFFSADHDRLDDLLRRATAGSGPIDLVLFGAFRAGLLRHIGMEEKALFAVAREARGGQALALAERLRVDHGAIAALLVPTPTRALVERLLAVLGPHNRREEETGGAYDAADEAIGPRAAEGAGRGPALVPRAAAQALQRRPAGDETHRGEPGAFPTAVGLSRAPGHVPQWTRCPSSNPCSWAGPSTTSCSGRSTAP